MSILRNWSDTWFMGVQCSQYYVDFAIWERLLNASPDLKRIVELGTMFGGFSLFLCLQAHQRGCEFVTFDNGIYVTNQYKTTGPHAAQTSLGRLLGLSQRSEPGDIFADQYSRVAELITRSGRMLLFCDNGDKPREFATFVPLAKPGDLIVVHDWGTEILPKHIDYSLVYETMVCECEEVGSMSRFFVRK